MKPNHPAGNAQVLPKQNSTPPAGSGNPVPAGILVAKSNFSGRAGISPQTQKKIFLQTINTIRIALNRALNELETLETEIEMTE